MKETRRAYEALNAGKVADAAVLLDNLMKGIQDMEKKYAPLLYVCTLFINREEEDRKTYDLDLAAQKIKDWEEAGIDRDFFTALGASFLSATKQRFEELIQTFSGVWLPSLDLSPPSGNESSSTTPTGAGS